MSRRIGIFLNPRSGSAPDRAALARALEKLRIAADIHDIAGGPMNSAVAARSPEYDVLVAAGGDGTVSAVAAAAAGANKTLAVIPAGTLNHFARDAGIPLELENAVALIARAATRLLDVGIVNGRIFVNNASLGVYPRMVWERNQARQRGMPKAIASCLAAFETWLELRDITVRLCVDQYELVRGTPFVVVGNGEYEVEGLQLGRRRILNGGRLSLYVAPGLGRVDALALPIRAILGRLKRHEKFEAWTGASITVDAAPAHIDVALDGEINRLETPLRFTVKHGALRAIVPEDMAD